MDKLDGYLAKRDINNKLHNKALTIAETAKVELGFDYKEIKGECVKGVCISPEELSREELMPKIIEETKKDSFKEIVFNRKRSGYKNKPEILDIEITKPKTEAKGNYLVRMESENQKYDFVDLFGSLNLEVPSGSVISYTEFESRKLQKFWKAPPKKLFLLSY